MLPDGKYVYDGLESEFVDEEDFFGELREKEVSGYIELKKDSRNCYGLIEDGEVKEIKILKEGEVKVVEGRNDLEALLDEGGFAVDVVDCRESAVEITAIKLRNKVVKTGISSADIDIPSFLRTNVTEQGNDCHIIILGDDGLGILTMLEGIPKNAKYSTEDEIRIGTRALDKLLDFMENNDVNIDVYTLTKEEKDELETETEIVNEQIEKELSEISDSFDDKADELLDDMGLGTLTEESQEEETSEG
ncbi:MAG: hypothetical protein ABEK59_02360 [Halobacteria archaeon]